MFVPMMNWVVRGKMVRRRSRRGSGVLGRVRGDGGRVGIVIFG